MSEIKANDFVIYDKANDHVLRFSNGDPIIYGNYDEAFDDCYGNESVVSVNELPQHQQEILVEYLK